MGINISTSNTQLNTQPNTQLHTQPNTQPRTVSNPEQIDDGDIYILEDLQKITLFEINKLVKWMDPNIQSEENKRALKLLNNFLQVQPYTQLNQMKQSLKQIPKNIKIKVISAASYLDSQYQSMQQQQQIQCIYLFCSNRQRARQLINKFSKIKSAFFDIVLLKNQILLQIDVEELSAKNNVLYFIQDDIDLINLFKINFHSLISSNSNSKAKSDFKAFTKKFYPNSLPQIKYFNQSYNINSDIQQKSRLCLIQLYRESFFWKSTQVLPKITTDPKKLGHLRFPIKQSYEAIKFQYKRSHYQLTQCFMVLQLTTEQQNIMKENIQNFLIFTTFVKAYSNQKKAREELKKNKKKILVRVMLKLPSFVNQDLDFGYVIKPASEECDIIFNIFNVFQILQYDQNFKQFVIQYGSLPVTSYIQMKERPTKLSKNQIKLIRNFYYLQQLTNKIDTKATALQMSGHFKDCLQVHTHKLEGIRKTQIQPNIEKQILQLGDAYTFNQQFDKAEQQYLKIKNKQMAMIADVHLAELYSKSKQFVKLLKITKKIDSNIAYYKAISMDQYFKAFNFVGLQIMNQGQFNQASKLYKKLILEAHDYYKQKIQAIPLVHQLYRSKGVCQINLKNYGQALNLLQTITDWEKVCYGNRSPNLILTGNLRKTAYQYRGQKQRAEKCQKQVEKIKQTISREQNPFQSRSRIFYRASMAIQQSRIHIFQ